MRKQTLARAVAIAVLLGLGTVAQALPLDYADIGGPGQAGTHTGDPAGTLTLEGSGSDIWETSDQFYYAYLPLSGDFNLSARISDPENTNAWAKAGIMARESLNANSRNTLVARTPTAGQNRITFQRRPTDGADSASEHTDGFTDSYYWLKLERVGDSFSGYWAPDASGTPGAWAQMGTTQTVSMSTGVYAGLALTAHDDALLCTTVFDNIALDLGGATVVSTTPGPPPGGYWDQAATWGGTVPTAMTDCTIDDADVVSVRDMSSVGGTLAVVNTGSLIVEIGQNLAITHFVNATSASPAALDIAGTLQANFVNVAAGSTLDVAATGSVVAPTVNVAAGAALKLAGTVQANTLSTAGTNTVTPGAVLDIASSIQIASALDLSGSTLTIPDGAINVNSGGSLAVNSAVAAESLNVRGGTATTTGAGSFTVNDFRFDSTDVAFNLGGTANVTGEGGTVNINAVAGGHTYSGATYVTGGTTHLNTAISTTAFVDVDGGTLAINQPLTTVGGVGQGQLDVSVFKDGSSGTSYITFDGAFTDVPERTFTGVGGRLADTPVEGAGYASAVDDSTAMGLLSNATGDRWQLVWTGQYHADEDGAHLFRVGQAGNPTAGIDDDGSFYVDVNGDHIFDSSEGVVTGGNGDVTATLTAGTTYDIAIGFNENTGGENFGAYFSKPSDAGAWTKVDPGAQGALWSSLVGASVTVANGTLDVNAALTTDIVTVNSGGTVDADAPVNTPQITINAGGLYNANAAGSAGLAASTVDINQFGRMNANIANVLDGRTANVGGTLSLGADGAANGAAITLAPGSYLHFATTQSAANFPNVVLQPFVGLGGDLTNAHYSGGSQNVTLAPGAILAATAGPEPTRTEAGGATLYQGITAVGSGAVYNLGDNNTDAIYRGGAFGEWTDTGTFQGTVNDVSWNGSGIELLQAFRDVQINSTTTFDTADTTRGTQFLGVGQLRISSPPNLTGGSNLITRTGFYDDLDGSGYNTTGDYVVRLDSNSNNGSLGDGQVLNVTGGIVSIRDDQSLHPNAVVNVNQDAALRLRDDADGRRPSEGTFNINAGGLLHINNNNRLTNGATFNLDPDAWVMFDHDCNVNSADPRNASSGFGDVNIIISENRFGQGLYLGDGRRLTKGWGQGQGTDAGHAATTIEKSTLPGFDPTGSYVIFCSAGSGDLDINSAVALPGVDIYINDPPGTFLSLPRQDANLTRALVETDGRVNIDRRLLECDDIVVRNGYLRLGENNDFDIDSTGSLIIRDGATVELQSDRPNLLPKLIGDTLFPGGVMVDKGGYFRPRYRLDGGTNVMGQAITFLGTGDIPGVGRDLSIFRPDEEGSGGNVVFSNLIFEEGAHVGIDRQDQDRAQLRLGITLNGNATVEREGDDFSLQDVGATGAYTLTVGNPADGSFDLDIYGTVGTAGNPTLEIVKARADMEVGSQMGFDGVILSTDADTGAENDDRRIRVYAGKDGTGALTQGTFQIGGGEDIEIYVDEVDTGFTPLVNTLGSTVHVLDVGRVESRRGVNSDVQGWAHVQHLLLNPGAQANLYDNDDQRLLVDVDVSLGDATVNNDDDGSDIFIGDVTDGGNGYTLTITGDDTTRLIGTVGGTANLVANMDANGTDVRLQSRDTELGTGGENTFNLNGHTLTITKGDLFVEVDPGAGHIINNVPDQNLEIRYGQDGMSPWSGSGLVIDLNNNNGIQVEVDDNWAGDPQLVNDVLATINVGPGLDSCDLRSDEMGSRSKGTNNNGLVILDTVNVGVGSQAELQRNDGTDINIRKLHLEPNSELETNDVDLKLQRLSGVGRVFEGSVTIEANGAIAPGLSAGTVTVDTDLTLEDFTTYEWELGRGAAESVIVGGDLNIPFYYQSWRLQLLSDGGVCQPTDEFVLFDYDGSLINTPFDQASCYVDFSSVPEWEANSTIVITDVPDPSGGGQIILSGLSAVTGNFVWDGLGDGNWDEGYPGSWNGATPALPAPDGGAFATVNTAADTVTVDKAEEVYILDILAGTVNDAAIGSLTQADTVTVGAPDGALDVSGGFGADTLDTAGTSTFRAGSVANIATVNVTGGTTTFEPGSTGSVGVLNLDGGVATMSSPTIGTLNANAGILNTAATMTDLNINGATVNTIGAATATNVALASGSVNLAGGNLNVTHLGVSGGAIDASAGAVEVAEGGVMTFESTFTTLTATTGTFQATGTIDTDGAETVRLGGAGTVLTAFTPGLIPFEKAKIGGGHDGSLQSAAPVYTIQGSGHDIWGSDDGFYYAYQEFDSTQPMELVAQVGVQDGFQAIIGGLDAWAKAGLMIRQSTDANSRFADMIIANTDDNGLNPQMRKSDGADALGANQGMGTRVTYAEPVWLKLEYDGDGTTFRGYYSDDPGTAPWIEISSVDFNLDTPLTGPALAGLIVTAHDNDNLTQVRFDNVSGFSALPAITRLTNLTGEGTIVARGDLQLTGALSPGDSTGIIEVLGNLSLDPDATFIVELNGLTAGFDYDQVVFGGDLLELNGAGLDVTATGVGAGDEFTIIDMANGQLDGIFTDAATGADLAEGVFFREGLNLWQITYMGGLERDDVVLRLDQVIPEPASLTLLALGGLGLLARRRRRR